MSAAIASFTYYYTTPTVNTPMPTYTVVPNCMNKPITYSLQMQDGSAVPAAFTLNTSTMMFVITQNVFIAIGTYNLKIVATETYSTVAPKFNNLCLWTVTILCTTSISVQTNPTPASTTYILDPNNLNTVSLPVPTYVPTPAACTLAPVYSVKDTGTSACPSWITCSPTAGGTIDIATTDWTLAGAGPTYNFRIDITDSNSIYTNSVVTFSVTIQIMDATSITVATTVPD